MSKVHQLLPKKVDGVDAMGNTFVIHLLGFMPSNLNSLSELPNLYLFEPKSQFHFFLRLEFTGDIENTRAFVGHYDLEILTNMYVELVKAYVLKAGYSLPPHVRISDVQQLLLTFRARGVCHSYGWLYRGMTQSFIFEVGSIFFHLFKGEPDRWSIPVEIDGVLHKVELLTSPTKMRLDPLTVFEGSSTIYSEMEDWFNTTVNTSPYVRAKFVVQR